MRTGPKTTFSDLITILFDRSPQEQFLIPMAASLTFGILFATAITLFLVPATYVAAKNIRNLLKQRQQDHSS